MQTFRTLALGLVTLGSVTAAMAQFDGPAPLAWRWSQSTSVRPNGSPLVDGNIVYVTVGQRMFALDKDSGNQKWKFPQVEAIPGYFRSEPIKIGEVLISSADNKIVYGVDMATGQQKWQYVASTAILGQPVALGKFIGLTLADDTLMVVNAETGVAVWQNPIKVFERIVGRATGHGDFFYVMSGDGALTAYSANTTKPVWSKRFDTLTPDSLVVVSGDTLYIHSNTYVTAMQANTGRVRWQRNVGEMISVPPAISAEGVVVATRDGKALLLDLNSGKPLWKAPVDLASTPVVSPGIVGKNFAFATANGTINLLSTKGDLLWSYTIRPIGGTLTVAAGSGGGAGGGGNIGGFGGKGGGGGAGGGGQTQPADPIKIFAIPAAGAPVLAGQTLLLLAQDGSLLAFDKSTGVDLTAPAVTMSWPNPGDLVNPQELEVYFKIEDEASGLNVSSLKIDVDGTPLENTLSREGVASIRFTNSGKNRTLGDGRHVFTVTATDWLGNMTTKQFALTLDNAAPRSRPPASTGTGGTGGKGGGAGGFGGGGIGGG